jgi:hypothetical protein
MKHYPVYSDKQNEMPIEGAIIREDDKVRFIMTFTKGHHPPPSYDRTIDIYFGGWEQYRRLALPGDEFVMKAYYNWKKHDVIFTSKNWKFVKHCDRYIGEDLAPTSKLIKLFKSKEEINFKYKFYDLMRDRLCLILGTGALVPTAHEDGIVLTELSSHRFPEGVTSNGSSF